MTAIQDLLQEISPDKPCGEDFSYHPSFQQLETVARGKPETQFSPAEDPNWKELRELSIAFLAQSKHLTAGVILTLALLRTQGFAGLRDGLVLMRGLVEKYWDTVYPRLDPEDNNDPTERLNIINNLASYGEPYRFILRLQEIPICQSASLGKLTYKDILAARTKAQAPEGTAAPGPTEAQVSATFRDSKADELQNTYNSVSEARQAVQGMEQFIMTTLGAGNGANVEELVKTLKDIEAAIAPYVGADAVADPVTGAPGRMNVPGAAPGLQDGGRIGGKVTSRDDVERVLDLICDYYRTYEPASPIPFILKRARRMVKMDFMQIINELTPDSISQVKVITGPDGDGTTSG
jgi:type VI secretion system protein ImpA